MDKIFTANTIALLLLFAVFFAIAIIVYRLVSKTTKKRKIYYVKLLETESGRQEYWKNMKSLNVWQNRLFKIGKSFCMVIFTVLGLVGIFYFIVDIKDNGLNFSKEYLGLPFVLYISISG